VSRRHWWNVLGRLHLQQQPADYSSVWKLHCVLPGHGDACHAVGRVRLDIGFPNADHWRRLEDMACKWWHVCVLLAGRVQRCPDNVLDPSPRKHRVRFVRCARGFRVQPLWALFCCSLTARRVTCGGRLLGQRHGHWWSGHGVRLGHVSHHVRLGHVDPGGGNWRSGRARWQRRQLLLVCRWR
jgi:hypothetical protein